jgi:hypothetical protein
MTGRALAAIAVKVWGAILVVGALASSPSAILFVTLAPGNDAQAAVFRASQIGLMLNVVLHAALGVALIVLADRIVAWVIADGSPLRIDVYASELSALGFALVGLFVLIQGAESIAAAVYTIVTKPSWPASDSTFWYVWERDREAIVRAIVQIIAGVLLLFGREAIVSAWWRLRGGVKEPNANDTDVQ